MVDLALNSEGDFLLRGNDLNIGVSDDQNINDILQSQKGDYKRSPQIGLNAIDFISATHNTQDIKTQVKLQLQLDRFKVQNINVSTENRELKIEPIATRDI